MNPRDSKQLSAVLEEVRATLADLAARVSALEASRVPPAAPVSAVVAAPVPPPAPPIEVITDDLLAAISAAVAAFLGKRAHVRQIRLISSSAWAQEGRVSVQASHRLAR